MEALAERKQVMELFNALPDDKIAYVLRFVQNLSRQKSSPLYPADSIETEAERRAQVEAAFKETAGMWSNRDDMQPVDDYIRKIRKGRSFDI
ncbi:MAG: hypothetical protein J6Y13_10750 [Treponema sp.]|nr:hypothetical protein [Treponema sp.]